MGNELLHRFPNVTYGLLQVWVKVFDRRSNQCLDNEDLDGAILYAGLAMDCEQLMELLRL